MFLVGLFVAFIYILVLCEAVDSTRDFMSRGESKNTFVDDNRVAFSQLTFSRSSESLQILILHT